MSGRRVVLVSVLASLTACSLFTDLGGFTGGDKNAAPDATGDGTTPITVTPGTEGGVLLDAGVPFLDAGFDSGGTPTTCPQKPVAICETFDGDEKVNGWTVVAENGATIGRSNLEGQPALVTSVPAVTTGNPPVAHWEKKFDKIVSKLSFDADFAYDRRTAAAPEYHVAFAIQLRQGDAFSLIYLTVPAVGNGFALQEFKPGSGEISYQVVDITPATAHHVHCDVEIGGRTHFAIDGAQVVDIPTPPFIYAGIPTLLVGVPLSLVPTTQLATVFDNLVFLGE